MSMTDLDVQESELRLIPGLDVEVADTLRALKAAAMDERPRLVDTTMLFAPRSGGVRMKGSVVDRMASVRCCRRRVISCVFAPRANSHALQS